MNFDQNNVPLPSADVGFSGAIQNRTRWDDNITWFNILDRVVITLRFFGPVFVLQHHWLKTKLGKNFPLICSAYDSATQVFNKNKCPVEDDFNIPLLIEEAKKANPYLDEENNPYLKEIKAIKARIAGLGHVVVRNNFQNNNSTSAKPWHPIKIPPSVLFALIRLKSMNRATIGGKVYEADVADPYWGRDVHIMYDSANKNPQARYMVNLGDHTPLTDVEKSYIPQLYQWQNLVEYPSYDEVKQQLNVNGYYQMLNQLKGTANFADRGQQQQQFAHMDQYLPQVPKSPYDAPTTPQQVPNRPAQPNYPSMPSAAMMQQAPQQMQMQMQTQMPLPQMNQGQVPLPQTHTPQVPMPQAFVPPAPVSTMNVGVPNLVEASMPVGSPLPTNVPPPLEDNYEIPFDGGGSAAPVNNSADQRMFVVKGRPNGVNAAEFQKIVDSFGMNIPRGKPFKACEDADLSGLNVLACYGNYCGDLNCVKCPLRQYCLHA